MALALVASCLLLGCALPASAAADDPCLLLTDADVSKVFPGIEAGQIDRRNEKYGILYCRRGSFYLRLDIGDAAPIEEEASDLVSGFLDPLKPAARDAVRYEHVVDLGDQAIAAIETANPARGILADFAMLFVQKSGRQVVLFSSTLAKRDRAEALRLLAELGKAAAGRL